MSKEQIFEVIKSKVCEILPELEGYEFKYDDQLVELGANSIDRADIVAMTIEELELAIPLVELSKASNMGELAEVLYEKLQSR